jgi:hypothetical protein
MAMSGLSRVRTELVHFLRDSILAATSRVGFGTTNFTRAWEPTLSWNQLHSLTKGCWCKRQLENNPLRTCPPKPGAVISLVPMIQDGSAIV